MIASLSIFLLLFTPSPEGSLQDAGMIFRQASEAESNALYLTADSLYRAGFAACTGTGSDHLADSCRLGSYRMQRILLEYPYTRAQADSLIRERCSWLSEREVDGYFAAGAIDYLDYQGSRYYFTDCVSNLLYRDLDLMHEYGRRHETRDPFYDALQDIVFSPPESGYPVCSWKPLLQPRSFLVEGTMTVPRSELPPSGLLRIWVPVPIQSSDQTDPVVLEVHPSEYVTFPPTTWGRIGTVHMEVPLEDLAGDLTVSVVTQHRHYTRRCSIDPEKVGDYNTDDPEYIMYTGENANISWTPAMEELAADIVGEQTNPYLQAELLYEYIVENIPYSHVPHMTLQVMGIPEAVFCHENGYGDCGTQSMYFCALCRCLGIPARACGGMQLIPGIEGSHFWAEFLLPGYGWVPVDVTVAETADWSWRLSEEQREGFKEFFFANLDPFRMVIQKDVSVPVDPRPTESLAMGTAIQFPAMVCEGSIQDPSVLAAMHWNVRVTPIDR